MKERKIATNASSGAEKVEEIVTLNEPYTETFVEKTHNCLCLLRSINLMIPTRS